MCLYEIKQFYVRQVISPDLLLCVFSMLLNDLMSLICSIRATIYINKNFGLTELLAIDF